jgi:putative transposon-encoded protein
MAIEEDQKTEDLQTQIPAPITQVRFEVYGEKILEKIVKPSGNSARVSLPPDWVGGHVKIIRIN